LNFYITDSKSERVILPPRNFLKKYFVPKSPKWNLKMPFCYRHRDCFEPIQANNSFKRLNEKKQGELGYEELF